jgi:hypothetical protein
MKPKVALTSPNAPLLSTVRFGVNPPGTPSTCRPRGSQPKAACSTSGSVYLADSAAGAVCSVAGWMPTWVATATATLAASRLAARWAYGPLGSTPEVPEPVSAVTRSARWAMLKSSPPASCQVVRGEVWTRHTLALDDACCATH